MAAHPPMRAFALLALTFLGFVSLGLPDGLVGVAWPSVRTDFGLSIDAVGALFISSTAGYVLSSIASGWLLAPLNIGRLLAASALATAVAMIGYASAPSWWLIVALGMLSGIGGGAIDAAINTFAARNYSTRTVTLLHACYGLGTAIGPALMTGVLMAGHAWRSGYLVVGAAQMALAVAFLLSVGTWPHAAAESSRRSQAKEAPLSRTLQIRAARISTLVFFLYVGLEATSGVWLYTLLHMSRGAPMAVAGAAVSIYWAGLMAGRVAFGLIRMPLPPDRLLRHCLLAVTLAAGLLACNLGPGFDQSAAFLLGFAAGPVFPLLIATTPARLGPEHTATA